MEEFFWKKNIWSFKIPESNKFVVEGVLIDVSSWKCLFHFNCEKNWFKNSGVSSNLEKLEQMKEKESILKKLFSAN